MLNKQKKKQEGYSKAEMIQFWTYMENNPTETAASASRYFTQKWGKKFTPKTAQRWNKISKKARQTLISDIESGNISMSSMRIRERKPKYPNLDKRLRKKVDFRIEHKLPRGDEWLARESKKIANDLGIENFAASGTYIARFCIRNMKTMKKKTSNRAKQIDVIIAEQADWLVEFRFKYKDDPDLTNNDGNFSDSSMDSMDEFPITLDENSSKNIDNIDEKVSQVEKFNSTMDLTKVQLAVCFFPSLRSFFIAIIDSHYFFLFVFLF